MRAAVTELQRLRAKNKELMADRERIRQEKKYVTSKLNRCVALMNQPESEPAAASSGARTERPRLKLPPPRSNLTRSNLDLPDRTQAYPAPAPPHSTLHATWGSPS